ncbi:hypothetical protein COHCIP112018_05453 [Cohnella sp. JJ-181]|nr:hypothetical protein COHCIP112018_05453 [Cohnella sp. JJ-181]
MIRKIGFFEKENKDEFEQFNKFANSNVYHIENSKSFSRIMIWSTNVIDTLLNLVNAMEEPYFVLYILHVSRTGQEMARYQSHEINRLEIENFFIEFGNFIENDGRHDIWVYSPHMNATVVYDKDNLIYLYGDMEYFENLLNGLQFSDHNEPLYLPTSHSHFYNAEYDQQEIDILHHFEWHQSPLRDEDY